MSKIIEKGLVIVFLSLIFISNNVYAAATSTLTISNPTTAVGAANICAGATKVPIHAFNISANGTSGSGDLTNFSFHPSGTFAASDLVNYKIWANTTNNLSTATLLATNSTPGTGDPQTFPAFTRTITFGTTHYFWITIDVSSGATAGRTITIGQSLSADMTTVKTKAGGPTNSSGTQTIITTSTPTAAPTSLSLSSITSTGLSGSFTAASPAANGYLVVRSTNSSLSSNPVDGTTYSAGNSLGGGTVVQSSSSTTFIESSLTPNTEYYYFVFSYNNICTIKYYTSYLTTFPITTCPGLPTSINVSSISTSGFTIGWTAPANGATDYTIDISLTDFGASIAGFPQTTAATSLVVSGLSSGTTYYYKIKSNNASCSSAYSTVASTATSCVAAVLPYSQSFNGSWTTPTSINCWTQGPETGNFVWHRNDYTTGWGSSNGSPSANGYTGAGGDYYARFHSYGANPAGGTGLIITPTIDLSTVTTKYLSFYYINPDDETGCNFDYLNIYISSNNGSSWSSAIFTTVESFYWRKCVIDLSSYNSATTKIKFEAISDWGCTDIGIDLVEIYEPTAALAPLTGSYNVGPSQTYPTIEAAVLDLNTRGVSGPTTFLLTSNSYTPGSIVVGNIVGASSTNIITFKPTLANTVITFSTKSGFTFEDADYITFDGSITAGGTSKDLTVTATAYGLYVTIHPGAPFYLRPGSSNVTIKNCIITAPVKLSSTYGVVAVTAVDGISGESCNNLTVTNNTISNGNAGIRVYESATPLCSNFVFSKNIIQNCEKQGIYVAYVDNLEISENTISDIYYIGAAYGIYMGTYSTNVAIKKNKISSVYYTGASLGYAGNGIYLNGTNGSNIIVSNNMIWKIGGYGNTSISGQGKSPCGIMIEGGSSCLNVFHNTIYMDNSVTKGIGAVANVSAAIAIYGSGGTSATGIDMQNNILYNVLNTGGNTKHYCIYITNFSAPTSPTFSATTINRNNYYNPGAASSYIANYDGTNYTLATWKTLTGTKTAAAQDANSYSSDPVFVSTTDLHLNADNNLGVSLASVPDDIDYGTRLATPDVGADEYNIALPVELISFTSDCDNNQIEFSWATASETNNELFTIEQSKDAKNFMVCEIVGGANNSNSLNLYSKTITIIDNAFKFFRLKQTDFDGKYNYSNTIIIDCLNKTIQQSDVTVFPNPANNELNLYFDKPSNGKYLIHFFDILGKKAKSIELNNINIDEFKIDLSDINEGIYILQIENIESKKIIDIKKIVINKF